MKAFVLREFGGPERLVLSDVPQPVPAPRQVVVRIMCTSLNPVDLKRASGRMRHILPVELPFVPGGDFSGVVHETGDSVGHFRPGDSVYGYSFSGGSYAEFIAIDENSIAFKPRSLGHAASASLCMVAQTAAQALAAAKLSVGQTILILGAGVAVGSVAVQLAKKLGARVIAVARSQSAARLRCFGADQVIASATNPFETIGKDVDVVLDALGGEYQRRSYEVLRPGGTLIALSERPSPEDAARHGVHVAMLQTRSSTSSLAALSRDIDSGNIEPFIGRTYPMAQIPTAWRDSRQKHIEGKIVFQIGI